MIRNLRIEEVRAHVAARYGLTLNELDCRMHYARVRWPRQIAMQLAREFTRSSAGVIARAFDFRTHCAVVSATEAVRRREAADAEFAQRLAQLRAELDEVSRAKAEAARARAVRQ